MTDAWARSRWWLVPLAVGVALRLALLPVAAQMSAREVPSPGLLAARDWRLTGSLHAGPEGLPPPLYPLSVAWALDTSSADFDPFPGVDLVQIGADAMALALLCMATCQLFGRRAGAAAGWLYALHPAAALSAGALISPAPLTAATLALAAWSLARIAGRRDGAWMSCMVLGMALGLTILADESGATIAAAVAGGLLFWGPGTPPRRVGLAAVVLGLALATTTPWAEHTRRTVGTALLSGTRGDRAVVVDNTPPGVHGDLIWNGAPDLASRHALARRMPVRALAEWPRLTAERAGRRLRTLLGPETTVPVRLARVLDGSDGTGPRSHSAASSLPGGTLGRVVEILCSLAVLAMLSLGAAGLAVAPGGLHGRTVALVTAALLLRGLLGAADDGWRLLLLPLCLPLAGLALALVTQREPASTAGARRAAIVGLGTAVVLTVMLFLLPPA